jgi:cytochrome c oxidase assembly protein subunit 15
MSSSSTNFKKRLPRPVRVWLLIGLVMVFFQVVIGGITRLTDSGLSITEWAVIQGTLPPMNAAEWDEAFEKYKVAAKKQYETLHADMTMSEFKVIFFWEYFHRLWARLMGFVFAIPFFFFLWKKWLPRWLLLRLGGVILLAATAATFGWIMVASGLNDDTRTWVSAYKLIIHLGIATTLFGFLFWTWLQSNQFARVEGDQAVWRKRVWGVTALLMVQILLGGLMAGMRAGLIHPYFPFFVEGDRLLGVIQSASGVNVENVVNYEPSAWIKGWVQILHRATAYILTGAIIWLFVRLKKPSLQTNSLQLGRYLLLGLVGVQFLLGVLTVINSFGSIPVTYGVLHQAGALLLLITLLYVNFHFRKAPTH